MRELILITMCLYLYGISKSIKDVNTTLKEINQTLITQQDSIKVWRKIESK